MKRAIGIGLAVVLGVVSTSAQAREWRALFNHVHSLYSDDNAGWELFKPTVAQIVEHAAQVCTTMGVEGAVTLTDHDTIEGCSDPGFAAVGGVVPICGEEYSTGGHAGVLGLEPGVPIAPGLSKEALVAEVHARGGIVIANHPRAGSWETDRRLGVDALEVWSVSFWDGTDDLALQWWQQLLLAGERITGVGASDSHFWFAPSELPTNRLLSESNAPADMMAAVSAGHVVIVGAPASPTLTLEADRDLDETYESVVGDVIPVGAPDGSSAVSYRVVVHGAAVGDRLVVVEGATETVIDLIATDGVVYEATRAFASSDRTFVRAELRLPGGGAPQCLTNPIYFVGGEAPVGTEGTIAGVVSANGAPLAGATITAAPGEDSVATSASDGAFRILVPNGTYTLTVTASGYTTATVSSVAVASGTTEANVTLTTGCARVAGGGASGATLAATLVLVMAHWRRRTR